MKMNELWIFSDKCDICEVLRKIAEYSDLDKIESWLRENIAEI